MRCFHIPLKSSVHRGSSVGNTFLCKLPSKLVISVVLVPNLTKRRQHRMNVFLECLYYWFVYADVLFHYRISCVLSLRINQSINSHFIRLRSPTVLSKGLTSKTKYLILFQCCPTFLILWTT